LSRTAGPNSDKVRIMIARIERAAALTTLIKIQKVKSAGFRRQSTRPTGGCDGCACNIGVMEAETGPSQRFGGPCLSKN
jgi:hypothetical protein